MNWNWEGDFQISKQGRTLADFSFQAVGWPPRGGEPYAVVGERRAGGRSALIRAGDSFFSRITGRVDDTFMLKACADLMQGFEIVHGESALCGAPDGMADISMRIAPMDPVVLERLEDWLWLCRRGPRVNFTMRGCHREECVDAVWRHAGGGSGEIAQGSMGSGFGGAAVTNSSRFPSAPSCKSV